MTRRVPRALAVVADGALWVTALLGAVSLVLALATVVTDVQPLVFRSSSMEPSIKAGALALARTVDADEVRTGDVVAVETADGTMVTHRVVKASPAGDQVSLTLKGDANAAPDEAPYVVASAERVFVDVPYLGYVANAMATPWALFVAGIIMTLLAVRWWRGPGERPQSLTSTAVVGTAAVGLALAGLVPVPRAEAYFDDSSTFEAGQIHAHQVRVFDWSSPVCTNDAGGTFVTVRTRVASPRYRQLWYVAPVGQGVPSTPVLRTEPSGPLDTEVSTRITKAMLGTSPAPGNYQLVGRSELKGSATSPWLSAATRTTTISVTSTGVLQCGTVNLPPTIAYTAPQSGTSYASPTEAQSVTNTACGRRSPCGTATDADGIYRVEYRLQRINFLVNRCWDPTTTVSGSYPIFSGCGTWRQADVTPALPTTSGSAVTWRIPLSVSGSSPLLESGDYTLYLRVTGNSSERMVTERTIQFTVR